MAETYSQMPSNSVGGVTGGPPTALQIVDMQDWFKHVKLDDTPVLDMITKDGPAPKVPMDKATWGWDPKRPKKDVLAAAVTGAADTTFTVTTPGIYQIGNLAKMPGGELIKIVDVNPGAGTIEVERGVAGTSATTYVSTAGVFILGTSFKEYDYYENTPTSQGDTDYNYHQIFQYKLPFSHRGIVIPTYESREHGDDRCRQAAQRLSEQEVPEDLEYTIIHQTVRQQGSMTQSGVMGGILTPSFIGTVDTSLAGAPLTPKILMDFIQRMTNLSKEPIGRDLVMSQNVARYIYGWYNEIRRIDGSETGKVANYIKTFSTPMGDFNIVPVRTWENPALTGTSQAMDTILIANLKDYQLTPLSSKSAWKLFYKQEDDLDYWGEEARMRGDYTLRPKTSPFTRGLIGGFSVTDADYPSMQ